MSERLRATDLALLGAETSRTPMHNATLEIFGPRRVMFGTDWPVCLLRLPHASWTSSVRELVSPLSRDEQVEILSGNARRIYALKEFNPLSNTR